MLDALPNSKMMEWAAYLSIVEDEEKKAAEEGQASGSGTRRVTV